MFKLGWPVLLISVRENSIVLCAVNRQLSSYIHVHAVISERVNTNTLLIVQCFGCVWGVLVSDRATQELHMNYNSHTSCHALFACTAG